MKKSTLFFIIALILFTIVAFDIYLWILISSDNSKSFSEVKTEYLNRFPTMLRNAYLLTLLNILLLSIAAFFFYKTKKDKGLKWWGLSFFYISLVLIFWQIFSLM